MLARLSVTSRQARCDIVRCDVAQDDCREQHPFVLVKITTQVINVNTLIKR